MWEGGKIYGGNQTSSGYFRSTTKQGVIVVYDLSSTSVTKLAQDKRLIQSILSARPTLTEKEARQQIDNAWNTIQGFKQTVNKTYLKHDGNCCSECGSIHLRTTGTCAVCELCGASQGCS